MRKKTVSEIKDSFFKVWGDRYDYSLITDDNYVNSTKKVPIVCSEHGIFWMSPSNHTKGHGCPNCSGCGRWTTDLLKERGFEKFGNRFDYSDAKVNGKGNAVVIKCNVCGTKFCQTPKNHISSIQGGCPNCRYKYTADNVSIPFDEFVRRSRLVHNDRYIYHQEAYKNIRSQTLITCPEHGDFLQAAIVHVKGCGCEKCSFAAMAERMTLNKDVFIERSKKVHGDFYDYSLVDYKSALSTVRIICPKHGVFKQTPSNHWRGEGCPCCKRSLGEERISIFLQINNIDFVVQYEISNTNIFCNNEKIFVDFFIPSRKVIIEYNGEQHYKPIKIWGGDVAFSQQQQRDISVRMYCNDKNIKLIEIPYTDFNNIEAILSKELKIKVKKTK